MVAIEDVIPQLWFSWHDSSPAAEFSAWKTNHRTTGGLAGWEGPQWVSGPISLLKEGQDPIPGAMSETWGKIFTSPTQNWSHFGPPRCIKISFYRIKWSFRFWLAQSKFVFQEPENWHQNSKIGFRAISPSNGSISIDSSNLQLYIKIRQLFL